MTTLRCSRAAGLCVLTQKTALHTRTRAFAVNDLLDVRTEDRSSPTATQRVGAILLVTRQGNIQFESRPSTAPDVDWWEIRDFIRKPRQRELLLTRDTRLHFVGVGGFLWIGAALLLALSFVKGLKVRGPDGRWTS